MIKAVDTNILLDILIPNTKNVASSLKCLMNNQPGDEVIVSSIVFAELGSQFLSLYDLNDFLDTTGIKMHPLGNKALYEASIAWKSYTSKKKRNTLHCPVCGNSQKMLCSSCGENINIKPHILSDFLIGAHAKIQADCLITRDRGFYRSYFKNLRVITPK